MGEGLSQEADALYIFCFLCDCCFCHNIQESLSPFFLPPHPDVGTLQISLQRTIDATVTARFHPDTSCRLSISFMADTAMIP